MLKLRDCDSLPQYMTLACLPDSKFDMYFFVLLFMVVSRIFLISRDLGTASNALLMSMVVSSVLLAGFFMLALSCICCDRLVSSVFVEWRGRKPCWVLDRGMCGVMRFSINRSATFDGVESRVIGL